MRPLGEENKKVWHWVALAVMGLGLGGCGPVTYVHHVVLKANSAVAAAKVHKAQRYAPYEYYGAVAYLEQARIRAGFGDFQVAVRYGRKSEKMAKKAVKLTKERIDAQTDVGTGDKSDSAAPPGKSGTTPPDASDEKDKKEEKKPETPDKPAEVPTPR